MRSARSVTLRSGSFFSTLRHTSHKQPHLILFVDVNGTIIAGDTERNKDRATSTLHMMSEWEGVWEPEITKEPMSYYDFVENHKIDTEDRDERRRQRDAYFANFLHFLKETNHPLYGKAVETFNEVNRILDEEPGEVFPSFTYMINELEKRRQPYTLIFRSFGTDTDFVLQEIEDKTGIRFKQKLKFDKGSLIVGDKKISDPAEMLAIIEPGVHGKWADDFSHWDGNDRKYHAAKPYPVNSANLEDTLTIFFDDNIGDLRSGKDPEKEIVHVVEADNAGVDQLEKQKEMSKQNRIVHLETLDAILDEKHFIKEVDAALKWRENYLEQLASQQTSSLTNRKD